MNTDIHQSSDLEDETLRLMSIGREIVEMGRKRGIPIRLIGGVAVNILWEECSENVRKTLRPTKDIDAVSFSIYRSEIGALITDMGFSVVNRSPVLGIRQQAFTRLDVRFEVIYDEMCFSHHFDLRKVKFTHQYVLNLGLLLLTKIQVTPPTKVDIIDIWAILTAISKMSDREVDMEFASVFSILEKSRGLRRLVKKNLAHIRETMKVAGEAKDDAVEAIAERILSTTNRLGNRFVSKFGKMFF